MINLENAKRTVKKNCFAAIMIVLILIGLSFIIFLYFSKGKQGMIKPLSAIFFNPPTYLITITGDGDNVLNEPVSVASSGNGSIFVADAGAGDIKVFDSKGKFKFKFNKLGAQRQLSTPVGLAVYDENVLVTDSTLNQIFEFNLEGEYKGALIPPKTKAELKGLIPVGIKIVKGKTYFTDILFHRVIITDLSGNLLDRISGPGKEEGRLAYPNDVAVNSKGYIYVSDSNNFRVQVSEDGRQFHLFKDGDSKSVVSGLVRGIAVDEKDNLWVVNTIDGSVQVFNASGSLLYTFDGTEALGQKFSYPNDIDLNNQRIYIADRAHHSIVVFQR